MPSTAPQIDEVMPPHEATDAITAIDGASIITINAIKKAFIALHELPAANDVATSVVVSGAHLLAVQRWIAPLESQLNIKAVVETEGRDHAVPAQIQNGQVVLRADLIHSEKQALDALYFAAVGLLAVPAYLDKQGARLQGQIFNSLNEDQLELLGKRYGTDMKDAAMVCRLYLAELASLQISPTFLERRDAWQKAIVRRLLPKLKLQSHELHYLIYRAKGQLKAGKL